MSSIKKNPFALYMLTVVQITVSVMGIYAGSSLLTNPESKISNGEAVLARTPFHSFLIPGLILTVVFGFLPLVLIIPLFTRHTWRMARWLNIYRNQYWAWTFSLYIGLGVIIWTDVQIYLIGYSHAIQTIFGILGLLMVVFAVWPSVMKYYQLKK